MKRTCNNCKALTIDNYCELGYGTEKIYSEIYIGIIKDVKPLEKYPKPLTIKQLLKESKHVL